MYHTAGYHRCHPHHLLLQYNPELFEILLPASFQGSCGILVIKWVEYGSGDDSSNSSSSINSNLVIIVDYYNALLLYK